jgi:hypothetical protein
MVRSLSTMLTGQAHDLRKHFGEFGKLQRANLIARGCGQP